MGEPHFERLKPRPDGGLRFSGSSSRGKSLCRPFSGCAGVSTLGLFHSYLLGLVIFWLLRRCAWRLEHLSDPVVRVWNSLLAVTIMSALLSLSASFFKAWLGFALFPSWTSEVSLAKYLCTETTECWESCGTCSRSAGPWRDFREA